MWINSGLRGIQRGGVRNIPQGELLGRTFTLRRDLVMADAAALLGQSIRVEPGRRRASRAILTD